MWSKRAAEDSCDAKIICPFKVFPVHRVVLRARSDVFDRMLSGDMVEANSGKIMMEDAMHQIVDLFLRYTT